MRKIVKGPWIVLIFIMQISLSYSQSNEMNQIVETLKNQGKKALILEAQKLVGDSYPKLLIDTTQFSIEVWANSRTVMVKFKRIIRYVPLGKEESNFIYDFSVDLVKARVLPFKNFGVDRFYFPTEQDQKNIEFVIEKFGLPHVGFINTILEMDTTFLIALENDVAFGRYYIDKITGLEAMPPLQGSYAPMPFPENEVQVDDPFIEIID